MTSWESHMDDLETAWGKPIATYTRAEALADGTLVDVSEWARGIGYLVPTAFTRGLWAEVDRLRLGTMRDAAGYVLLNGRIRAESKPGEDLVEFHAKLGGELFRVWLVLDGDGATLMRPEDY